MERITDSRQASRYAEKCQQIKSTGGQLRLIFFGLRRVFRPVVRAGLRVANGLRQHLAELSLRLRRFPRDGFLPVSHTLYMGMLEANATKNRGYQPFDDRLPAANS